MISAESEVARTKAYKFAVLSGHDVQIRTGYIKVSLKSRNPAWEEPKVRYVGLGVVHSNGFRGKLSKLT